MTYNNRPDTLSKSQVRPFVFHVFSYYSNLHHCHPLFNYTNRKIHLLYQYMNDDEIFHMNLVYEYFHKVKEITSPKKIIAPRHAKYHVPLVSFDRSYQTTENEREQYKSIKLFFASNFLSLSP